MLRIPCIIRKNTQELRNKLQDLGLEIMNSWDTTLDGHNYDGKGHHRSIKEGRATITYLSPDYGVIYDIDSVAMKNRFDCGTNEELFLALVALRDDTDYMQYFTDGNEYILCDREDWMDMYSVLCSGGKYTVEELNSFSKASAGALVEHFNKG